MATLFIKEHKQSAFTNWESRNNYTTNAPEFPRNAYICQFTSALVIKYVCSRFLRNVGNYFKMPHYHKPDDDYLVIVVKTSNLYIHIHYKI